MIEEPGIPSNGLADPSAKLVLIVDDDMSILDLMEHVVRKEGFKVERGADGAEAVHKARTLNPDLILLDFMLPGMGGYEVVKELQVDNSSIPVVIFTGRQMDRSSVEMVRQERNVRDFLQKPVKPAVLCTVLHRLLKTRPPEMKRAADRGPLSSQW